MCRPGNKVTCSGNKDAFENLKFCPAGSREKAGMLLHSFCLPEPEAEDAAFRETAVLEVRYKDLPVGVCCGRRQEDEFSIQFLYLEPAFRRPDILKRSLQELLGYGLKKTALSKVNWKYELNAGVPDFYERLVRRSGCEEIRSSRICDRFLVKTEEFPKTIRWLRRFDKEQLEKSGLEVRSFSHITEKERRDLLRIRDEPERDLLDPLADEDYDPEMSFLFTARETGVVCGFAVCRTKGTCCEVRKVFFFPEYRKSLAGAKCILFLLNRIERQFALLEYTVVKEDISPLRVADHIFKDVPHDKTQMRLLRFTYPVM